MSDIVAKMRSSAAGLCTEDPNDYMPRRITVKDCLDAAAEIESLRAKLAEARKEAGTAWDKCEERRLEGHAFFERAAAAESRAAALAAENERFRTALKKITSGVYGYGDYCALYVVEEIARAALGDGK